MDLLLSVLLLFFKAYQFYSLFTSFSSSEQSLFLQCMAMSRSSIYEQALTLILTSIIRTQDREWFYVDDFTDSILHHYKSVSSYTKILISILLWGVSFKYRSCPSAVPRNEFCRIWAGQLFLLYG